MAYKSKELTFHLTPAGWSAEDVSPSFRVESWRFSVYQETCWSKEQRSWIRTWHSSAWSEADLESLRQSFPAPTELDERGPHAQLPRDAGEDRARLRAS